MLDPLQLLWHKYYGPLKEFRERKCADYCPICGDNCCNGRLNPAIGNMTPFKKLKRIRYRWDKPPADGPYIIDHRLLWWGSCYIAGTCPFLADNLCQLYGKPERPWECQEYPLYLQAPFGIPLFRPFIGVEKSCNIFRYEKNCTEIEALAAELGLDLVFHPSRE